MELRKRVTIFMFLALFMRAHCDRARRKNSFEEPCYQEEHCDHQLFLKCDLESNRCRCSAGSKWLMKESMCYVMEGEDCFSLKTDNGSGLCVPNAHCSYGKCRCNQPEFLPEGDGTCRAGHGTHCDHATKICSGRNLLYCDNSSEPSVCKCQGEGPDFIWNPESFQCETLVDSRCDMGPLRRCVANASCVDGFCVCDEGYSKTPSRQCLLRYKEKCNAFENRRCNKHQYLNCLQLNDNGDGICECQFFNQMIYEPEADQCRSLVGEYCNLERGLRLPLDGFYRCVKDAECVGSIMASNTNIGHCQCKTGRYTTRSNTCSEKRQHGYPCSIDGDCESKLFLKCIFTADVQASFCKCDQGMFYDGKDCIVHPGRSCLMNKNCGLHSYCDGDYCICKNGYVLYPDPMNPVCIERLKLSLCDAQPKNYVWSLHRQTCLARLGSECQVDEECVENGYCDPSKRICVCRDASVCSSFPTSDDNQTIKQNIPGDAFTHVNRHPQVQDRFVVIESKFQSSSVIKLHDRIYMIVVYLVALYFLR